MAIPTSWTPTRRKDAISGAIRPTAKPDLDYFLKAAIDACNGVVFADDAKIVEISAKKIFGTVLTIHPMPEQAHAANTERGQKSSNEAGGNDA